MDCVFTYFLWTIDIEIPSCILHCPLYQIIILTDIFRTLNILSLIHIYVINFYCPFGPPPLILSLASNTIPVSYTHLDVYKRQADTALRAGADDITQHNRHRAPSSLYFGDRFSCQITFHHTFRQRILLSLIHILSQFLG